MGQAVLADLKMFLFAQSTKCPSLISIFAVPILERLLRVAFLPNLISSCLGWEAGIVRCHPTLLYPSNVFSPEK